MSTTGLREKFSSMSTAQIDFTKYLPPKLRAYFDNRYRLTNKQKTYLFRQLSYLIESGYSIELTLRKMRGKEGTPWHKAIVKMIMVLRETGSLTNAMAELNVFSPEILYQVEGGELSGDLPSALIEISKSFEAGSEVTRKLQTMMIYPLMLLAVLFTVMYIISTYIMPQIMSLVTEMNAPLSLLSKIVISLSNAIATKGTLIITIAVLLIIAVVLAFRQVPVRRRCDWLALKLGVVKNLTRMTELVKYCRVFHSLYRSGVGLEITMDCAAKTVKNMVLRNNAMRSKWMIIKDGADFAEALAVSRLFDETEIQLIDIGAGVSEEKMCEAFETMAERTTRELETQIKTILAVMEPVSVIVVGLLVGLFVVGIYSPVFSILQSM